jgi:hypothetical protein
MIGVQRSPWPVLLFAVLFCGRSEGVDVRAPQKPLFREFMGINGHTIQFRPERYAPAVKSVRDYHPLGWDLGDDTAFKTPFPMARNGVDWGKVYGDWKASGYETDVCVMLTEVPAKAWKDLPKDAAAYGRALAKAFGPSSPSRLVAAVEVGNEPGHYEDAAYREVFQHMASGLRAGDPKLKIGTCALALGESDKYSKSLKCIKGLESLYDFLNIHTYAQVEGYPTWRRSYPEDPKIDYLAVVTKLIAWRDQNAPGKEVRVTEFGWDASTKKAPATGDFSKWVGSTETEQAQYIVRSFLVFSRLDVTRAYIFFFDDKDEPQIHGSSGLTRNGQPKPAFHAVAHLLKTLGDYRFSRVVEEKPGEAFVYEYVHGDHPTQRIWAVWSPTGSGKKGRIELKINAMHLLGAERMPTTAGKAAAAIAVRKDDNVVVDYDESPVFVRLTSSPAAK